MSWQRRAAAPRLIDWTGERCVPWAPDIQVVYEHFHRYLWATRIVTGRRVLDLGSGEGFGSAALAGAAEHVVGVDIDKRTIEHSKLNYAAPNLEFHVASALDLTMFETGSFGAVVAFEIIEHVREQEQVLAEIARLLAEDGVLVISTPDRRTYSEASGNINPFHERELGLEEFRELLEAHFPHVASWGQRTITGSHMSHLSGDLGRGSSDARDFFIERSNDEWRLAGDPAALYCVAIASRVALPELPTSSTLADCDLGLVRHKERELGEALNRVQELSGTLERERTETARVHVQYKLALRDQESQMREELVQRDRDIELGQETIRELKGTAAELRGVVGLIEGELAQARQLNRRTEESVTWQAFQKMRGRLYGAIGESSLLSKALRLSLRLAGRVLVRRPQREPANLTSAEETVTVEVISLPEYENPRVSLIIPVYAHAELTRACLHSIRENTTHASYEVIIVDDAADVETKRLLEGVRGVKVIHNDTNLGYLRSVNHAASSARGRWLVIFNNDTEVTRGWLREMLDCAESAEDIGVVTPKFVYPDGSLNEAGGIIWQDGTGMNYGRGDLPDRFQYEYRRETDYGSAAALMVSGELWREVGGFDERYLPMYYEDADLCFEARERGLRVVYEPTAVVFHIEGATAGNDVESGHKRYQEQNRSKFVAKWRHRLEAEHLTDALPNVRAAANRERGAHVLVVDYQVPRWDHDAGSLRMLSIVRGFLDLGARVTFMPDNFTPVQPYTRELQHMGVEVFYGSLDINAELATIGPKLDLAILSRPHVASRWLDALREFAPGAKLVYDTVDLHWLREARKGAAGGQAWDTMVDRNGSGFDSMAPKAKALRELELAMIRAADATIVVSDSERLQVERDVPGAEVSVIPTVHDAAPYVPPPEGRKGILFLGGFAHPPNVDAAIRLAKEVMPNVWRELGDVRLTIVGPNPPPEVLELASPLVDVTGWVADLQPLFDQSRLMVAPLRYGAGLKGKVTQSLAVGLPVVTTSIGAEGLVDDEECVLVGADASELAAHAVSVHSDDDLWRRLSQAGQRLIEEQCSTEVVTERLAALLSAASPPASGAKTSSTA